VIGVGATGSGRQLTGILVGADVVKNEITAHATAALHYYPEARTVLEIGGQDSKIIILRDQLVVDFAMNTVCAAGTGSFLDHQSERLGIPIEQFGDYALRSKGNVLSPGGAPCSQNRT
jgi:activator of 2-hydroxyglutaryl-CoA dehydratase